jgi:hypothetical protein
MKLFFFFEQNENENHISVNRGDLLLASLKRG